jgi:hypothetical protein
MMLRWCAKYVVVVLGLLFAGCGLSDDGGEGLISIRSLTARYEGYPLSIADRITIVGEVVSTDRSGEFYNRVIVQDATGGVMIMVDCDTLHLIHSVGDRISIECRGLRIGGYGRGVRLGVEGVTEQVGPLTIAEWRTRYNKDGVSKELHTTPVTIGELSATNLSTRVLLEGVRFVEAGECWAEDGVPLSRHIVDCSHPTDTLQVRMSGYSEFWSERIPSEVCDVVGVLDYFGNNYQLLIASPDAVFVRD